MYTTGFSGNFFAVGSAPIVQNSYHAILLPTEYKNAVGCIP